VRLRPGQNGVSAEGTELMYAAALAALTARHEINVAFDEATSDCFINHFTVFAP
jgi:hypothetical protein